VRASESMVRNTTNRWHHRCSSKITDIYLMNFLINRSNQLDEIKASQKQQEKIFQEISKDR
jgi:hypothetical protein